MVDFGALTDSLQLLAEPSLLWLIPLGLLFGTFVGAIPGLTASLGLALVLPVTFYMTPVEALIFLSSIFTGGTYGGSITAILINMPGSPASAATAFDGFEMTRKGKHNHALGLAIGASALGSLIGCVLILLLLNSIASFALMFGPVEMLMVGVFALTIVAAFRGESSAKGLLAGGFGLLLGTIGLSWGREYRGTFDSVWLLDGLPLVPVLIGLLAVSRLFELISDQYIVADEEARRPNVREIIRGIVAATRHRVLVLRASLIGVGVGALPAAGASVATIVAWNDARQSQKHNQIGKGDPRGVVAAESANNSSEMGSTALMLALGIPGGGATAVMLGAFLIHGLTPGPRLLDENMDLGYSLFMAQFAQILLLPVAGILVLGLINHAVRVPTQVLVPVILALTVWGVYTTRQTFFDVGLVIGFGLLGFLLRRYGYSEIPVFMGVILAAIIEPELVRAVATHGAANLPGEIVTHPISAVLLALTAFNLYFGYRRRSSATGEALPLSTSKRSESSE